VCQIEFEFSFQQKKLQMKTKYNTRTSENAGGDFEITVLFAQASPNARKEPILKF